MKHIQKNVDRLFSQIVENRELSHMKPLTITTANVMDLVRKARDTLTVEPFKEYSFRYEDIVKNGFIGEFVGFVPYYSSPYKNWIETV